MTKGLNISLIAAMSENRVIGKNNSLPWHIPKDMKWFRDQTRGKPVIMGRKTYESIGRLLPKRKNIIISRDMLYAFKNNVPAEAIVVNGIDRALEYCAHDKEIMIIGGGEIYSRALPLSNKMYLTIIHAEIEGDTLFPDFDKAKWQEIFSERHDDSPAFTFKIYEKSK